MNSPLRSNSATASSSSMPNFSREVARDHHIDMLAAALLNDVSIAQQQPAPSVREKCYNYLMGAGFLYGVVALALGTGMTAGGDSRGYYVGGSGFVSLALSIAYWAKDM